MSNENKQRLPPPAEEPPSPCGTEIALVEAQFDLDNADFHFGFLMNPLRRFVFKPLLDVEAKVLPPLAKAIPPLDPVMSLALKVPFTLVRNVYHITHSEQSTAQWKTHRDAAEAMDSLMKPKAADKDDDLERKFEFSEVYNYIGFQVHSFFEFWSQPKYNLNMWTDYTKRLVAYCKAEGIEDELLEPILANNAIISARIIGAVQEKEDNTEMRRFKTAIPEDTDCEVTSLSTVAKLMRYCCASYGKAMMDAHDILVDKYKLKDQQVSMDTWKGGEALKQQVCGHVGIPSDYITHFYLGAGGDLEQLRYYISADRDLGAVVLVIRGTYSITQWHIDFQGQSKPFCGGEAHSGMADLATAIVKQAQAELRSVLNDNPTYKLMITGQSLGGGVSPLVNMLLHMDPVIGMRDIECHAFAGPPVYHYPGESLPPVIAKSIADCTHYIHGNDTVPYLSLHQVRRDNAKLAALEEIMENAGFWPSLLTAMGRKAPTEEMVNAALFGDADVKPIPGGPKLIMPAKQIVWFLLDEIKKSVNYVVCEPKAFSELSIYLCGDGISDHVPQTYEYVLNKAEDDESGWHMKRQE